MIQKHIFHNRVVVVSFGMAVVVVVVVVAALTIMKTMLVHLYLLVLKYRQSLYCRCQ